MPLMIGSSSQPESDDLRSLQAEAASGSPAEHGPRWALALLAGTLLAVAVNLYVFVSDYIFVSSRLTFAYLPMGLMLPFTLFIMVVVPLLRTVTPKAAFTRDELIVIFVMGLVGSVFPTLSMVGFIPSMLAPPYYYATAENQWPDYLLPHLPQWPRMQCMGIGAAAMGILCERSKTHSVQPPRTPFAIGRGRGRPSTSSAAARFL